MFAMSVTQGGQDCLQRLFSARCSLAKAQWPQTSLQRLIVSRGPLGEEVVFVVGEVLGEGEGDKLFLRIDLAIRRGRRVSAVEGRATASRPAFRDARGDDSQSDQIGRASCRERV